MSALLQQHASDDNPNISLHNDTWCIEWSTLSCFSAYGRSDEYGEEKKRSEKKKSQRLFQAGDQRKSELVGRLGNECFDFATFSGGSPQKIDHQQNQGQLSQRQKRSPQRKASAGGRPCFSAPCRGKDDSRVCRYPQLGRTRGIHRRMLNARQEFGPGGPGPRHSALAKRPEPRRLENGTIEILRTECECGVRNAKESMG